MLPQTFEGEDGFVSEVVYYTLCKRIDRLMDSLYRKGVKPRDMRSDISGLIDSEIGKVNAAGMRPDATLTEALAYAIADWYYEERNDVVQFCIDNYVPPSGSKASRPKAPAKKSPAKSSRPKSKGRR